MQHWISASREWFLCQCATVGEPLAPQSQRCGHSHPQKTLSNQLLFPTADITWVFTPIPSTAKCEHRNQGRSRDAHTPASTGLNSPSLPEAQHKSGPTISQGHEVHRFASQNITPCRIEMPLPDQKCAGQHPAPTQSTRPVQHLHPPAVLG